MKAAPRNRDKAMPRSETPPSDDGIDAFRAQHLDLANGRDEFVRIRNGRGIDRLERIIGLGIGQHRLVKVRFHQVDNALPQ